MAEVASSGAPGGAAATNPARIEGLAATRRATRLQKDAIAEDPSGREPRGAPSCDTDCRFVSTRVDVVDTFLLEPSTPPRHVLSNTQAAVIDAQDQASQGNCSVGTTRTTETHGQAAGTQGGGHATSAVCHATHDTGRVTRQHTREGQAQAGRASPSDAAKALERVVDGVDGLPAVLEQGGEAGREAAEGQKHGHGKDAQKHGHGKDAQDGRAESRREGSPDGNDESPASSEGSGASKLESDELSERGGNLRAPHLQPKTPGRPRGYVRMPKVNGRLTCYYFNFGGCTNHDACDFLHVLVDPRALEVRYSDRGRRGRVSGAAGPKPAAPDGRVMHMPAPPAHASPVLLPSYAASPPPPSWLPHGPMLAPPYRADPMAMAAYGMPSHPYAQGGHYMYYPHMAARGPYPYYYPSVPSPPGQHQAHSPPPQQQYQEGQT